jgi:hypothetical protein
MGSTAITYAGVALAVALVCLLLGFFWGRSNVRSKVEQALEQEHVALDAREFGMRQQLEDAFAEVARLRPQAEELGRVQERLKSEQKKYEQMRAEFNTMLGIDAPEESTAEESAVQHREPAPSPESADDAIQRLLQSLETFNQPGHEPQPTYDEAQRETQHPQPFYEEQQVPPSQEKPPQPSREELRIMAEQARPSFDVPHVTAEQHQPHKGSQVMEQQPPPSDREPHPINRQSDPIHEYAAARAQALTPNPQLDAAPAQPNVAIDEGRKRSSGAQRVSESRPETVDEWQEFARSLADLTRRNQ